VVICAANAPATAALPAAAVAPAAATPVAPSVEPVAEVVAAPAPDAVPAADAMALQQPASLTRNDLIAQTFAALDPEFTAPAGELTARKVRTVSIGPDGMPIVEGAPTQVAEASSEPVAEAEAPPVEVAATEPADEAAPAAVEADEEEPSAVAYAPVRGGDAVVGRQGANVRSLPQTKGSDVLFALASGEEVTITETSKGWSKVVDARGRSGWIWGELLRR
jgi:antitoxin (DNA-binding transcriptional repressor) of toxin-antitoxin stability system